MIRIIAIVAIAALLGACSPSTPASGDDQSVGSVSHPPAPQPMTHGTLAKAPRSGIETQAAFAKRIGVDCARLGSDPQCIGGKPDKGDIYDVELMPDCGPNGFFGGVSSNAGAELRDTLPPNDTATPAKLGHGQLVCIQAIGRAGQDPSYFYVVAVPTADVQTCRDNRLCNTYGDRAASGWALDATQCRIAGSGRPTSTCPQGWARHEDIEDFSNGM